MSMDIGTGCKIHPTAIIHNDVWIGDNVYIGPYAIIGAPPQHRNSYPCPLDGHKYDHGVELGNGVVVREFTTIHAGIITSTVVGRHTMLMAYTHVSHDCQIGDHATLSTGSILGGVTMIGDHATLGQGVITHPWALIGEGSIIGLNSSVIRDVLPYQKVAGCPARLLGPNTHQAPHMTEWSESALSEEARDAWGEMMMARKKLQKAWAS